MRNVVSILCVLGAMALTGCMEQIPVTYYPPFYHPDSFQAIGIRSFEGATATSQRVGDVLAGEFAVAMVTNGSYSHIYNLGQDRQVDGLDGIIIGRVEDFSAEHLLEVDVRPGSAPAGGSGGRRLRERALAVNEVTLTVSARMETPSGQILYATPEPVTAHIRSAEGGTEGAILSLEECYYRAIRQVSAELVRQFAVTEMIVSVVRDEALFVATTRDDKGDWIRTDMIPMDEPIMTVVLRLPAEANGNIFVLAIIPKGKPDDAVARESVLWYRGRSETGQAFVFIPIDLLTEAGTDKLEVQLRSGESVLMSRDFTIVQDAIDLPLPEDTEAVDTVPLETDE
jgi:hypothetical protein